MKADVIGSGVYSLAQLRAAVFEKRGLLTRPRALSLLGRRRYRQRVQDLEQLLIDETEDPRLRNMAALLLGRVGTADAERSLERGLYVKDAVALRGVLGALGGVGGKKVLLKLHRLKKRRDAVGEAARNAVSLIGYRLGTPGSGIRRPQRKSLLRVTEEQAQSMEVAAASGKALKDAVESVACSAPRLHLTARGATILKCGGHDWMLLLTEEVARSEFAVLGERKAIAGVVVRHEVVEGNFWELCYYVLSQPAKKGADLLVTTGKGHLFYAGVIRFKDERVEFEVRSVDRPQALAIEVIGTYEGARVKIERALSEQKRRPTRKRALNPR